MCSLRALGSMLALHSDHLHVVLTTLAVLAPEEDVPAPLDESLEHLSKDADEDDLNKEQELRLGSLDKESLFMDHGVPQDIPLDFGRELVEHLVVDVTLFVSLLSTLLELVSSSNLMSRLLDSSFKTVDDDVSGLALA